VDASKSFDPDDKARILKAIDHAVGAPQLNVVIRALLAETMLALYKASLIPWDDALVQACRQYTDEAKTVAWSGRTALHAAAQRGEATVTTNSHNPDPESQMEVHGKSHNPMEKVR